MIINKTEALLEAYRHMNVAIETRRYLPMYKLLRVVEKIMGEKPVSRTIPDNPLGLKSMSCWERAYTRMTKMYDSCRKRARESNIEFGLDFEKDWMRQEWPTTCPMLGIPLNYGYSIKRDDFTPSLDRIDSKKGYVLGNIAIISWRANRIKFNASVDEMLKIGAYMELFS